ncbi:MAG: hypothetical protein ACREUT_00520 [Steroidobacteraceae bacterium]
MLATLAGCGGGSGDGNGTTYTIGGTVMGLGQGGTVSVLLGTESLSLSSNGAFTFPSPVTDLTQYAVTVGTTMPTGQTCGVFNGSGAVAEANVTNVGVYCTDDVSAASLDGTYEIESLNVNTDTDQLYTAVPFDGSGTQGSSTVTANQAGTTFTTSTDNGGVYTVTTAEALPAFTVGTNNAGGIAGADGDEFYWVANDVNGGAPPALFLGVKPLQTATLSALAGNWIIVGLTQAATPSDSEGSVAIAADGSFNGSESTLDFTGAATTQTVSGAAGSYAVTNNVVSIGGQSGYISANGDFAVLTAVTQQPGGASANNPGIAAAVKQGSGITPAILSGVYSIAILGFETASTGNGGTLTLYFDGVGDFGGTATQNDDGTYSSGSVSGTYTVTSNGVLTLTDTAGDVFTGGVSADGNAVVAAYLTASAATPEILVGFKQ